MLESCLIKHCAPTLAKIKMGNLFRYPFAARETLTGQIKVCGKMLEEKGIRLCVLDVQENSALVYVYREAALRCELSKPDVQEFLRPFGYSRQNVEEALKHLRRRIADCCGFPHEIGIFLGYPLGDVLGFIQNKGRNCKCEGCWKVYDDEHTAQKTFARYRKCKNVYLRLWKQGRSVLQLTVGASSLGGIR